MTMTAHFDGQVFVPDRPVELPVGRKVRVELEPLNDFDDDPDPPGTDGDPQPNDPESIARWIAESQSIPAAYMSPEEEADWLAERKSRMYRDVAAIEEVARALPESHQ